jgi:hypothetical protein
MRAPGVAGFSPNPPQEPPFEMPSIDVACWDTEKLWPQRISPNRGLVPWLCEKPGGVRLVLAGETGKKLGELLCKLVEWMIAPPPIDLTLEGLGATFEPPPGTTLSPASSRIPSDLLALIAGGASYSV